jgi:hypothetical protein
MVRKKEGEKRIKNYCMKDRDSERKGICIKRRKEKKHLQIKELKDWAFSFLSSFLNFLAIISLFHSQILLWPQYPASVFTFISLSGAHVSLNTASCYILFVFG